MEPVRTALIGLGYWGPNLLRNFSAQPECAMVACCDLSEERIAAMKAHYPAPRYVRDAKDVFADPAIELVLIATPPSTHFALAKAALEAGKHVFVEKPMAGSSADAAELVRLAAEKGRLLMVDHTFVFAPAVEHMADLARRAALGDLLYFDSVRINLGLIQKDANVLWDLAVHDLSILSTVRSLDDVASVAVQGSAHFGQQTEMAHMHLAFADGFTAHIHVSWLSPVKIRKTILAGTGAMVSYDDVEPSEKIRVYDRGIDRDLTKPDPMLPVYRTGNVLIPALPAKETLGLEAAHVLRAVRGLEAPRVPGESGLAMLRILEAADASIAQGGSAVPLSR